MPAARRGAACGSPRRSASAAACWRRCCRSSRRSTRGRGASASVRPPASTCCRRRSMPRSGWRCSTDSSLIARKIADCPRVLCAAPAYLEAHGRPALPEDLLEHRCLLLRFAGSQQFRWTLTTPDGPVTLPVAGALDADDGDVLTEWALLGQGIALKPLWEVAGASARRPPRAGAARLPARARGARRALPAPPPPAGQGQGVRRLHGRARPARAGRPRRSRARPVSGAEPSATLAPPGSTCGPPRVRCRVELEHDRNGILRRRQPAGSGSRPLVLRPGRP